MQSPSRELIQSIGLLILRLGIGGYLLTHGIGKLQMLLDGKFEMMGDPIGLGPTLSLVLIFCAEFICSILVILGLATRFAAIPVVFGMGVAAFAVHGADPWRASEVAVLIRDNAVYVTLSKEPALMYLIAFLALIFTGPGGFSIDRWIRSRRQASGESAGESVVPEPSAT